jgi:cytochrome c oxidase subunit II
LASDNMERLVASLPEEVIDRGEHRWMFAMAAILGIMLAVIVVTGMAQMLHPLSSVETIDPTTLHLNGEFVESNLGTAIEPDGSATVRFVAEQYMFVPQCVKVPVDTLVRFRLTSADVTHGFFVGETNTNAMVVPGFISNVRAKFTRTGEYKMPCDEFCGYGHHAMAARVVVVPREEFQNLTSEERITCAAR